VRKTILAGATMAVAASFAITGAAAASPSTGIEHFSFITTATSGNPNLFSAIATGAFTAGGTANLPSGKGTLKFSGGTIKTTSKSGPMKNKVNSKLCLVVSTQSGTYKLVGGTGVYKGISGSGKYTARFTEVGPIVGGKCSTTANAVAAQGIITGSGPVTLP
jgi:hypothetical protein